MSLSLNCLIYNDDPEKMFTVEIQKTDNVSILKQLIKEAKAAHLDHVDASDLELWKVCLSFDAISPKLENNTKLSPPMRKLSEFFGEAVDDVLHIMVKAPEVVQTTPPPQLLSLRCLVVGDDLMKMFTVEVRKTANVSILRDLIKEKGAHRFRDVDSWDLGLSHVSIPLDDITHEKLKNVELQLLKPYLPLSEVFPHVEEEYLHIIVQAPTNGEEGRRDQISSLHKKFESVISGILKAMAPANLANSSMYTKSQIAYSIIGGRYDVNKPRTSVAPPIQLFHPVFGHFLDDTKNDGPIPDEVIRQITDYMKAASAIYTSKNKRQEILMPLLSHILGVDIQTILNQDKTGTYGIVELVKSWGRVLLLLEEDKNGFGDSGSDPSTQAGLSVGRCWAQSRFKELRYSTCCPTFILATAGPWIAILGAVITDGVIVQRLTDYVWVGLDSVINESHITNVARIFYALKTSLEKLNSYYDKVQPAGYSPADSRYFPSITTYPDGDKVVHFKYKGFLEDSSDCSTLRAQTYTEPAKVIVVKFVDRYGEKAHRLLAASGLAPELIYCGSLHLTDEQPLYHSLSMVVMDYIVGNTLPGVKEDMNAQMREKVRSELRRALGLLHDHGLVFGDLRPPNVMITNAGEVKLIDFDWAGEEGQAKYPYLISPAVDWPVGVKALAVMKTDHDLDMLNKFF